ncbi:MAG TPA: allantoicase, partial [Actinomycetes bacterium]|nr:allantoicase [Actinomycetes bacterium]
AGGWTELLPRTRLQPDTRHLFRLPAAGEVTGARLDVYPDGGMARVRLYGELSAEGLAALGLRWLNSLPVGQAREVLERDGGLTPAEAEAVAATRPVGDPGDLPEAVRSLVAPS